MYIITLIALSYILDVYGQVNLSFQIKHVKVFICLSTIYFSMILKTRTSSLFNLLKIQICNN